LSFISELKRRNVIRVGIAYAVFGWLVLQVADIAVPIIGLPDWVVRLVLVLLLLAFPPVLVFAWVFELTPEGLKRESDVDREDSITPQTGRRLDRIIIVVLVLALAWFAWDRFRGAPDSPESTGASVSSPMSVTPVGAIDSTPVVAVLPFRAVGSDDGGFLAGGLHDDLLTRLAKLGAFRVISRTSMMEYANTTKNMRLIGEELGAGYILEGGVQAMGDRVRITAQLIDAAADQHIWAEVYNRELTANNLFDVQAELAVAIAQALQTELSAADLALVNEIPTQSVIAYNAYLRGLSTYDTSGYVGTPRDREAADAFREAVRLDPGFALAWAGLSTAIVRGAGSNISSQEAEEAMAALKRARELQPGLLETELSWAEYQYRVLHEYERALNTLDDVGDRLAGNAYALQLKAWLNRRLGRYEVGYQTLLAARRVQPRSMSVYVDLIHYAWLIEDCDAAGEHARQLMSLAPDAPMTRVRLAEYELECTGNADRAVDLIRHVDFSRNGGVESAFWAAWRAGDVDLLMSLVKQEPTQQFPELDALRQISLADIYRWQNPDDAMLAAALRQGERELENYLDRFDLEHSASYAALRADYHSVRGDAEETAYWIAEHKVRFRNETKGDISEESKNRFAYAWDYAAVGMKDEAVEELRLMLEAGGAHRFPYIDGAPPFTALAGNPAYIELKARYGH